MAHWALEGNPVEGDNLLVAGDIHLVAVVDTPPAVAVDNLLVVAVDNLQVVAVDNLLENIPEAAAADIHRTT